MAASATPSARSFWPRVPRQPFIALAVAAVLGICAADKWEVSSHWALGFTACGVLAVLLRPALATCWLLCGLAFFQVHTARHYGGDAAHLARILASGPRVVAATGIVWNEPEKPPANSAGTTARFLLKAETLNVSGVLIPSDLFLNVTWTGPMPAYGDRVFLRGSVANLREKRNPGQFDFASYQQRRGIHSEIHNRFPTDCEIQSKGHGRPVQVFAFRTSHWIQRQLQLDLEDAPEISDLISSMVLGLRGETPEDMRALFQRTGTMHLFAVSGLNVAMLAAIILALVRPFGIRRGAAVFVIVPILAGYALVTGLTPSCVRATVMVAIVLFGQVVDRRALTLNSLGAAAFFILLWDTEQLFLLGFQFSFILVITIVCLAGRIQRPLAQIGHPDSFLPRELWNLPQRARVFSVGYIATGVAITIAAWLGSMLFTAGHFHLFSPSTLVANFIAVPLAFVVLILGLASVLAAPLWTFGVVLCNNANWFCAKLLLGSLEMLAHLPGSYVYVEMPRWSPPPACEFTVLDLGDGGAAFLRAEGRDWLIDCGGAYDYERTILPYLRSRGVNRLDGLLLTHGDAGHMGGAATALDDFQPRSLVESALRDRSTTRRKLQRELERRGRGKGIYMRGDIIHIGPHTKLRVLYPPAGLRRSSADDMSLVLQLEVAGSRVLFMSDSGFNTERWLLENEHDLRSDLLVKGHHPKDFSGTPDFVARVQPQAVICTAAAYGLPPATLDPWVRDVEARGIAVFRQDRAGAVQVEIREEGFDLRGYLNDQIFRSRAR